MVDKKAGPTLREALEAADSVYPAGATAEVTAILGDDMAEVGYDHMGGGLAQHISLEIVRAFEDNHGEEPLVRLSAAIRGIQTIVDYAAGVEEALRKLRAQSYVAQVAAGQKPNADIKKGD